MEIQSNISAASLFEGLSQSQTQGTGAKDDAFSKMMDRMISEAVERKREQTKNAARQAQDERAEAKRQQAPVRAERPRLDAAPPPRQTEKSEPSPARSETAEAKSAPRDEDKDKVRAKDDAPPRKAAVAKTDKPAAKDGAAAPTVAAPTADKSAADAASADDGATVAATEEDTTGGADGDPASDGQADAAAPSDTTTVIDATLTVTETVVEIVTPTSDTLLASLQLTGLATQQIPQKTDADATATTTAADAATQGDAANAAGSDPAAQLAARLAQARQAAATAGQTADSGVATDPNGQGKDAKVGAGEAPLDPAKLLADGAASDEGDAAQALPSDDDGAIPTSFADLIAAAKAKMGDKAGGKTTGGDAGTGKNDGQPQSAMLQPPPPPGLEALKGAADSQAVGALASATAAVATTETVGAHAGTAAHTHAALAAMEAPRAAAQIDMTQATASLRPSRGTAGAPLGVPDQVAVHIKKNVADDVDQFTINLHPAELGRIDIKLDIGADGRVSAMVAVEKAQTLELLQRDSRGLERALQDAGLQTDSNSLSFSLRGDGNQSQGDGNGNGSGKRGRGLRGGAGDEADPGQSAAYTVTVGDGRLDIRA
ncbi:flagellar hook-length control protein FliK [Azospirillum sp.]|uniref:flagellar hook-length control protein FliK n=1 Tax=Azospirillum sp. TaxID=34012 RepID=UPI00262CD9F7|nr:flagellar hook-length control protein FliK [Azospirillum sp.]